VGCAYCVFFRPAGAWVREGIWFRRLTPPSILSCGPSGLSIDELRLPGVDLGMGFFADKSGLIIEALRMTKDLRCERKLRYTVG
jgi:hypothetical protein